MSRLLAISFVHSGVGTRLFRDVGMCASRVTCPAARPMRMSASEQLGDRTRFPSREQLLSASFMDSVQFAGNLMSAGGVELEPDSVPLLDAMLLSSNGCRGFFVTLLSQPDIVIADRDPLQPELKRLLCSKTSDPVFVDLLVKNVVMSSAMVLCAVRSCVVDLAHRLVRRAFLSVHEANYALLLFV
jgi:hypothetical protein